MLEIISRPPADHRNFSLFVNQETGFVGFLDEIAHRKLFPWIADVDQMVLNCQANRSRSICRTYIEVAIDLNRVGVDNRKPLRIKIQQKFCLSDPGRAEDENTVFECVTLRRVFRNGFHLSELS